MIFDSETWMSVQESFRRRRVSHAIVSKGIVCRRQLALVNSPKQIGSIQLSSETTSELRRLFDTIMEEYVGIRLKSKKFLNQMVRWETLMQEKRTRIKSSAKRCLYLTF